MPRAMLRDTRSRYGAANARTPTPGRASGFRRLGTEHCGYPREMETIDDWTLAAYVRELVDQGQAAELAMTEFASALTTATPIARAYAAIQSLLAAGALVSKVLWPNPPRFNGVDGTQLDEVWRHRAIERGRRVRAELLITGIPILESRKVRNALEHFDDRLDDYLIEQGNRFVVDRNIGPRDRLVRLSDGQSPKFLRHIDPQAGTVSVLDDDLDYRELSAAIADVSARAASWLAERHNAS